MRDVNFYLTLMIGIFVPMLALADEPAKEETVRADLQNAFMSKPITAKKLYREAWNKDNLASMSIMEQMEYLEKNTPEVDEDMKIIMRNGIKLMKKMNFGLENQDISDSAASIQKDPAKAIQALSENASSGVTLSDLMAVSAEISEPGKRLMEKVYQDKSLGRVTHTIDPDVF